ncbi:chemotaxis protein CheW [Natronorubrum halophilum]|uniref:chemotaxis protein CheW n=1 Tax=Natronorubrum halophilum TaxID=1702106 RepID=UPI000EF6D69B|nr:chemotaxis protein CheW [Natronorubrum halophilum]
MGPDLSEKLLGIDIGGADNRTRRDADGTNENEEERKRFVFFEVATHRLAVPVETVDTLAEVPEELTRVPRTPAAIDGMVDLRGEVTAVIDPTVHFPSNEPVDRDRRERLLVLDRSSDQQSAAIRVDGVIGVKTVPESDVLDEATVEDRDLSGDALEHPLVVALIERERESDTDAGAAVATNQSGSTAVFGAGTEADGATMMASSQRGAPGDAVGTPFEVDATEAESNDDEADSTREIVVEVTPVVDVETFLLASGQREPQE